MARSVRLHPPSLHRVATIQSRLWRDVVTGGGEIRDCKDGYSISAGALRGLRGEDAARPGADARDDRPVAGHVRQASHPRDQHCAFEATPPFTGGIVQQWSRSDVEARSRLVFNAIQPFLDRDIETRSWDRLTDLFERVAMDKKILAVGFCDQAGTLIASTPEMPADFGCEKAAKSENESFSDVINERILRDRFRVFRDMPHFHHIV